MSACWIWVGHNHLISNKCEWNNCFIKNPHKISRILPTLFVKTTDFQLVLRRCIQSGHLLGCNKNSEIVRYFQGRLCDKIGLLCDELCGFFRPILHCFTRFQRRKTTLILFNMQFECKGIIKHLFSNKIVELVWLSCPGKEKGHSCVILHDAVTPHTMLLVSEIIQILNLFVINKIRFLSQKFLVRKRWVHETASSMRIHESCKQSIEHKTQLQ